MADRVPVRLGWKRTQDGDIPRIGRPHKDGREWPGDYLFFKVVNPGKHGTFEFLGEDCVEEVFITHDIKRAIKQGHLIVADPDHPLAVLNQPDPAPPAKDEATPDKPKKKKASDKPKEID